MATGIPFAQKKGLNARLLPTTQRVILSGANSWTMLARLATSKPRQACFSVEQYVFVAVTRLAGATLQDARSRMSTL